MSYFSLLLNQRPTDSHDPAYFLKEGPTVAIFMNHCEGQLHTQPHPIPKGGQVPDLRNKTALLPTSLGCSCPSQYSQLEESLTNPLVTCLNGSWTPKAVIRHSFGDQVTNDWMLWNSKEWKGEHWKPLKENKTAVGKLPVSETRICVLMTLWQIWAHQEFWQQWHF